MQRRVSLFVGRCLLNLESLGIEKKMQKRSLWYQACRQHIRFTESKSGQLQTTNKTNFIFLEQCFLSILSRNYTVLNVQAANGIEQRGFLGERFTRSYAKKASKNKSKAKKPSIDAEMAEGIIDIGNLESRMNDVISDLNQNFAAKIPSRITAGYIDNIMIKLGSGKKIPLYEMAQVQTNKDSFLVNIQDNIPNAAKLISESIADTGFNLIPQIKGDTITIPIPVSTEDNRQSVAKLAKGISDEAKAELRKVRQKGMSDIRKNKDGQSKDLIRRIENQVQQLTDFYTERIESALDTKTKEITGGKFK